MLIFFVCLFDLILYVPSTIFQLNRDGSSWVEPVLSYDKCVLLKDHNAVTPVRLEPAAPRPRVKHSSTEPLRSLMPINKTNESVILTSITQRSLGKYTVSPGHSLLTHSRNAVDRDSDKNEDIWSHQILMHACPCIVAHAC